MKDHRVIWKIAAAALVPSFFSIAGYAADCRLSNPIVLPTEDPIGQGIQLGQVVFDSLPVFPNAAAFNPSTDTLDLDGFEILSSGRLTGALGLAISVVGSSDPGAILGFERNTASAFRGAGETGFYDNAPNGHPYQHFWTGDGPRQMKILILDHALLGLELLLPVGNAGNTQHLCLKSAVVRAGG